MHGKWICYYLIAYFSYADCALVHQHHKHNSSLRSIDPPWEEDGRIIEWAQYRLAPNNIGIPPSFLRGCILSSVSSGFIPITFFGSDDSSPYHQPQTSLVATPLAGSSLVSTLVAFSTRALTNSARHG